MTALALPRPRRRIWLPLPLTPILILLSPLLLPLFGLAALVLGANGVPPGRAFAGLIGLLFALRGTRLEVDSPQALVLITLL